MRTGQKVFHLVFVYWAIPWAVLVVRPVVAYLINKLRRHKEAS
jgi:hypothetical protein